MEPRRPTPCPLPIHPADPRTCRRMGVFLVWVAVAQLLAAPAAGQNFPEYLGPRATGQPAPSVTAEALAAAQGHLDAAFQAGWDQDYARGLASLQQAEGILTEALREDPYSRDAAETLGVVYFYRGYFGEEGGFPQAVRFLTRVLEVDAASVAAGRYLAHSYHHSGDPRSARLYADWVMTVSTDPNLLSEMDEVKRSADLAFLGGWYEYSDFYGSDEARVISFDAETRRMVTRLQVTPELETQLAARSFQQLAEGYRPLGDDLTQRYLQSIVDRLMAASPVNLPYPVAVDAVESDQVNAYALPGRLMVHTGLLRFAENEAELVAVLAHELAHIYAHHAARQLVLDSRNRDWAGALISLTGIRDRVGSDLGRWALDRGTEVALDLIHRGYQRGHEEEADRYGTHIAFNAGYNPTFMTSFFIRLFEADSRSPIRLLATHPPYAERIESTSGYLENFPLEEELQLDSREFQEMRSRLGGAR
ncbi:MAG: M48 family metalloprotease [Gemmatimonadota bacterium]